MKAKKMSLVFDVYADAYVYVLKVPPDHTVNWYLPNAQWDKDTVYTLQMHKMVQTCRCHLRLKILLIVTSLK